MDRKSLDLKIIRAERKAKRRLKEYLDRFEGGSVNAPSIAQMMQELDEVEDGENLDGESRGYPGEDSP